MRTRIIALLAALLALAGITTAQDQPVFTEMALFGTSDEAAFVFFQQAQAGSLALLEGTRYTLTLTGVPSRIEVVRVAPAGVEAFETADLVAEWQKAIDSAASEAPGLPNPFHAPAELQGGFGYAYLVIEGAAYDAAAESITYTVDLILYLTNETLESTYDEALAALEPKEVTPSFGPATLAISGSNAFIDTLRTAVAARLEALRFEEACVTASRRIQELSAALAEQQAALAQAAAAGDSAAIVQLSSGIRSTTARLKFNQVYTRTQCP
jgi:hypothetical protein